MSQNLNHEEAFFFVLEAATAYFKYADYDAPEPTGEDLRMVTLYQNYIDALVTIGGEEL
jgi:hypothetical protein